VRRRVVVTGLGAVTPLGPDAPSTWAAMREGRSAIGPLRTIPTDGLRCAVAAEIPDFDPAARIDVRRLGYMDRFTQFAVFAAAEALDAAGLRGALGARAGVVIGAGTGGAVATEEGYRRLFVENAGRVHAATIPRVMVSAPAAVIAMETGARGPVFAVSSACASANHAIGTAMQLIRAGAADVILAGGTEAPLCFGGIKGWEALRVLAPDTCRPFSRGRAGLVLAEGAAVAVLEDRDHARARGAPVLGEILGFGMTADAGDLLAPSVEGALAAVRAALADAGLAPEDIDHVNAHGSGTVLNDATETKVIRAAFGRHADRLSVSATKAMHGHALGATGAIELIAVLGALRDGVVPPTVNHLGPDPDCDLDVTPNVPRRRALRAAISNAFAFGGLNAVLAIGPSSFSPGP
jgi:nodulation protein E